MPDDRPSLEDDSPSLGDNRPRLENRARLEDRPGLEDRPEIGVPRLVARPASHAEVTEAAIAGLVDRFYANVRLDPVLGPIFEAAIAADAWPEHLATMRRFWSSVMLTSGRYSGNPVGVHRAVLGLERPMFARWLRLFGDTVEDLFESEPAAAFLIKAHRIAGSLELAIFHRLGSAPDGLPPRVPGTGSAAAANTGPIAGPAGTASCD